MARLAPLEPPYADDVADTLAAMMPPGVPPLKLFRTVAHNPRVLGKLRAANLLDRGSLERRHREIAILRATARGDCAYEWGVHVAFFAGKVGLTPGQVEATVRGDADHPGWDRHERSLIALVDELHEAAHVSGRLWKELRGLWSDAQLVELVVLAGFYRLIAGVCNAFAVDPEPGAPGFPD